MNLLRLLFLLVILASCRPVQLFPERSYSGGGNLFKIFSNNTFEYRETRHGKVYKFSTGTWKRNGNKLLLYNNVNDAKELPLVVKSYSSTRTGIELVINVLPQQEILPPLMETFNLDILINNKVYPLKNETNLIRLDQPSSSIYFRAYLKSGGIDVGYTVLNDTLRSQTVNLQGKENKILTIDVDCNPFYFAKVKLPDDTLRIISDHKMKWGKIYLERPN